jgi:hypothetical protein
MANLNLPPNVKQDPNTGLYLITNAQGKTVRVNADTQEQLNQYVNSVNTGVPAQITITDPNTGNPRTRTFDSNAIISEREAINKQNELLTAGKRQAGVIGNRDGSYQDLRTGQTISKEQAEAKIKSAGLPPETLAAVTPKNSPAYAAAQQSIDQTATVPSNIPPVETQQPSQSEGGNSTGAAVTASVPTPEPAPTVTTSAPEPVQVPVQDSLSPGEELVNTSAPEPVDTPLLTPAESIARAQITAPADVDTAVDGGNGSSYTPGGTGASSANSFAAGAGTGDGLTDQERAERDAAIAEKTAKENAINQATRQSRYKQAGSTDWRVRLQLAPTSNYLYNAPIDNATGTGPGILAPLAVTNGVVFPYTPQINTTYRANYESYDLVHSNYRGVYYKNSRVDDVTIRAVFTAQDTTEADYLLAVIHFFRSVTKMFYGKDPQRGSPPPLVYLNGLGPNQFSGHPCVVTSFQYNLPDNVDYIRATSFNTYGTDLLNRRTPSKSSSIPGLGATGNRLVNAGLALVNKPRPSPDPVVGNVNNTQLANYVPTKMEIDITLIPVQTRSQVSKQFSLSNFANGNLIKGGYW